MRSVLFILSVWPEPASSSAGSRTLQLAKLFADQGSVIHMASAAAESEFAEALEPHGYIRHSVMLNHPSFDAFIKELQPDLVVFDRFMTEEQFGWRVARHSPASMRVLDTIDLHGLRTARETAHKKGRSFEPDDLFSDTMLREAASIYRSDLALLISPVERALLEERLGIPGTFLYTVPFMLDPGAVCRTSWASRRGFVSIGNFRHPPNADAVKYLHECVWPAMRKRMPEAVVHVYGAYMPPGIQQLNDPARGFLVMGRAECAGKVLADARVLLAPVRYGAGLKGKLVEAMQSGTPSVTTSAGMEGMEDDDPWCGAVEDDPDHFAAAAVRLHEEKVAWVEAQERGFEKLARLFDGRIHGPALVERLQELEADLDRHRRSCFTSSMLHHQAFKASEYMARWIEEKNRCVE